MYTIQANPSGTRSLEVSEENLATIEKYEDSFFTTDYTDFHRLFIGIAVFLCVALPNLW